MSTNGRDLLELRRGDPTSAERRKMAANIIAVGVVDQHEGCRHERARTAALPTDAGAFAICLTKFFAEMTGQYSGFAPCGSQP
ncbi:hypothetical protein [Paraburkholderia sp. RL17-337-BIB-A]|uniref:hypothetical protein n=1 Tax=Paraburkholderia sp. RL17-337-BIB-A TaxID=3031636 RepID=UPI0038B8BDD7